MAELPIFNGENIGLVPAVGESVALEARNNYFLNAAGLWAMPQDARIGDLGGFNTVEEYVADAIEDARMTWEAIEE